MRRNGRYPTWALWLALASAAAMLACGRGEETASYRGEPVAWAVSARTDKSEVQVGEALELTVTVRHPPGADFLLPAGANLDPFELVERIDEPADSPVESRVRLRIAAYRLPAELEIPSIEVEYRDEAGESAALRTEPIPIKLVTSLTPDVTDIHDIKGPIADLPLPGRWGHLWWLLAALLAAIAGYLLYRRWAKRDRMPALEAPPVPLLPPAEEAEEALRELAEQRLLEVGRHREFYVSLSEILKRYAGRRFGVPYLERTSSEILYDLRRASMAEDARGRFRRLLDTADLVKFARVVPSGDEAQRSLPEAFRLVDETRPKPRPALEPSGAPAEVTA